MSSQTRVLLLGATGRIGRCVAPLLAAFAGFQLGLAGRSRDRVAGFAAQLGAEPVVLSTLQDERALDACLEQWDVVINAAGPEQAVILPVLRACIRTRTAYGDIGADYAVMRQVLALDRAAREAGVTALCGMGTMPGATCLLARHAMASIDAVEEVLVGVVYPTPDRETAAAYASAFAAGQGNQTWYKMLFAPCSGAMVKNDYLRPVDPRDMQRMIRYPGGIEIAGTVSDFPEVFLLDRACPSLDRASVAVALDDPIATAAWHDALDAVAGGASRDHAAAAFFDRLSRLGARDAVYGSLNKVPVVNVTGTRDGRRVRHAVQTAEWIRTEALMLAMAEWLASTDRPSGVFSVEDVLDAVPFFTRAYDLTATSIPSQGLLVEETVFLPETN